MKFYDCSTAPSPRRARIFIAEKGLLDRMERVEVNLRERAHLTPEFAEVNPFLTVPVLELDGEELFELHVRAEVLLERLRRPREPR